MSKIALALLMIAPAWSYGRPSPPDEPREMLAQAEQLYDKAEFSKSIELLLHADELLQKQAGPLEDKANVKFQLALDFIGLNDNDRAKAYFLELYRLTPEYRLDADNLAPKVITLADEARNEISAAWCRVVLDEAQSQLQAGNADAVVKLIAANKAKCPAVSSLGAKTANLILKDGVELFRKFQLNDALKKFQSAIGLDPGNEVASQYLELTLVKLEVTADRTLIAFHKDFNAGDYASANRDYQQLVSVTDTKTMADIRQEYRQALTGLAESWKRSCAAEDTAAMERITTSAKSLVPEPEFGQDILATMQTCVPTSCIPTDSSLAMTRIEKKVDPIFSPAVVNRLRGLNTTVRVKARIDVKGSLEIKDIQGGDPLLYNGIRDAVQQWKFRPTLTELGARCVDTEIPILIKTGN